MPAMTPYENLSADERAERDRWNLNLLVQDVTAHLHAMPNATLARSLQVRLDRSGAETRSLAAEQLRICIEGDRS